MKRPIGRDALPRCARTLLSEMQPESLDCLLEQVRREQFHGTHLEIGTAAGGATRDMMLCFNGSQRPAFVAVDPMTYFPDQLATIRRNLSRHGLDAQSLDIRATTSARALPEAVRRQERFDLILIDGATGPLDILTDLKWSALLNRRGLLCLHHCDKQHPAVNRATARFIARHPHFRRITQAGSLVVLKKTGAGKPHEIHLSDYAHALFGAIRNTRISGATGRTAAA